MKGKFITLVLTLGFLAAFGVFMHSPPSILDGLTGATPKAKRAAQMAAPLEGNYLFCINVLQNSLANGPSCLRKSIFDPFLTNGVT